MKSLEMKATYFLEHTMMDSILEYGKLQDGVGDGSNESDNAQRITNYTSG
jgi:hypothetical protein